MTTTNTANFSAQDDETQMMLAASEASDQQLPVLNDSSRPSVTVSIPDQLKTKLAGVSDHVRNSLETALLDQAIADWSALQTAMVQSFGTLNTIGPQRFPLENFLRDALESISAALRSHSMANVASADDSVAQVSLGFNPRATENLSSPRMMMKLLQIIEKIYAVTLEEANQRKVYVTKIDGIKRDKVQLEEKLRNAPADTVENRAIRSALELDISRMGPQITAVQDQITKLDKRVADIAVAAGKLLNVHYQPEKLAETVDGFIQAVRDVPTVATKLSPKELSKLSGNPSLSFTIELPKVETVRLETPVVRPPVPAKKAPARAPAKQKDVLPRGARLLGTIRLPSGIRARLYSGSPEALDKVVDGLNPGSLAAVVYTPPATQYYERDEKKEVAGIAAIEYAKGNIELFATRYEKYTRTQLPEQSQGHVEIFPSGGPIFYLNGFPVGIFNEDGVLLPEEDLVEFLTLLYGGNFPIIGSC